jgi:hypothetical protein
VLDLTASWDTLSQWYSVLQNHVPVDRWPDPLLWSSVAVAAGAVLLFWGSRLLRKIYVLVFMVIGGSLGVRLAGVQQVDRLIGLTLGGGAGALLAFLLFRWWVGLTTGALAVLLLLAAGSPRLNQELLNYNNTRLGVGTDDFSQALRAHAQMELESWEQLQQFGGDFWEYLRTDRRSELIKTAVGLGLVALLGTLAGVLLPRLITIGATAVGGAFLIGLGGGVLLSTRWPAAWAGVKAHNAWLLAALAVLLVCGISYQARRLRRPIPVSAPLPAAA